MSRKRATKVNVFNPRLLTRQHAWYYLPIIGRENYLEIFIDIVPGKIISIRISGRKILRELLAAGIKPV